MAVAMLAGLVAAAGVAMPALAAQDRVALVMAVEDYAHLNKSLVSIDTAQKIADALKKQGFDVSLVKNPANAASRAGLSDFAEKAKGAEAAVVILTGHGASAAGRTYYLPQNAEITRDSDLLSRALALPIFVQIVGKAKFGAVFFLMTAAEIPSTLQSISARPSFPGDPDSNVVVVFSSSDKVPLSRVDRVSQQAAVDFAEAADETPLMVESLVNAAAAGGVGKVFGKVPTLDLSKAKQPDVAAAGSSSVAREAEARREAERRAKEAEDRVRQVEAEARQAEQRAREAEERARSESRRAQQAGQVATPAAAPASAEASDIDSLRIIEALFGRGKRKRIQYELRQRDFYKGPIDAIFGDQTRQAIADYQRSQGSEATGYLTPQQLQALIGG
ncbi:MAG: peptidoglycan-binding protein [Hyphomicrobiaceae bacterium]|nr:peptidoglycan-binding protein [Hyphomicrobiaceae bacterium]